MRHTKLNGNQHPPGVLRQLRALAPDRRLRPSEARNVAELQANRLLELAGLRFAEPVPIDIITELPHVRLIDDPSLPIAGTSHWDARQRAWVIRLNPTYSSPQRRFTLLHEFKHIIDFRPEHTADRSCDDQLAELAADHFAACVLLPKRAVRHAWGVTASSIEALAAHFEVPESIARVRLEQLGLSRPSCLHAPARTHLEAA